MQNRPLPDRLYALLLQGKAKEAYLESQKSSSREKVWSLLFRFSVQHIGVANLSVLLMLRRLKKNKQKKDPEVQFAKAVILVASSERSPRVLAMTMSWFHTASLTHMIDSLSEGERLLLAIRNFKEGIQLRDEAKIVSGGALLYMWHRHAKDKAYSFDVKLLDTREEAWKAIFSCLSKDDEKNEFFFRKLYSIWREQRKHFTVFILACICLSGGAKCALINEEDIERKAKLLADMKEMAPLEGFNAESDAYIEELFKLCPPLFSITKARQEKKLEESRKLHFIDASRANGKEMTEKKEEESRKGHKRKRLMDDLESVFEDLSEKEQAFQERTRVMRKERESEIFQQPLRLRSRDARCHLYLAVCDLSDGVQGSYLVKGPFFDRDQYEAQTTLDTMKDLLDSNRHLSSLIVHDVEIVPDLFRKYGNEKKPFLAFYDIWGYSPSKSPRITHPETGATFFDPSKTSVRPFEWEDVDSFCREHPTSAICFLCALAFRYIFEVHDTDRTNFFLDTQSGDVYSLEETSFMAGPRSYFTKRSLSLQVASSVTFLLRKHWNEMSDILGKWKDNLEKRDDIEMLFEGNREKKRRAVLHVEELMKEGNWLIRLHSP